MAKKKKEEIQEIKIEDPINQPIFEFLKKHMRIEIDSDCSWGYYEGDRPTVVARIVLTNPSNGKDEIISSCSATIY